MSSLTFPIQTDQPQLPPNTDEAGERSPDSTRTGDMLMTQLYCGLLPPSQPSHQRPDILDTALTTSSVGHYPDLHQTRSSPSSMCRGSPRTNHMHLALNGDGNEVIGPPHTRSTCRASEQSDSSKGMLFISF